MLKLDLKGLKKLPKDLKMLKKLSIKNFKSIDEEELKIVPLTILTGINSTGKSTVIQSILLALKFAIPINRFTLDRVVSSYTSPRDTRNRYTNKSDIQIQLQLDNFFISTISLSTQKDKTGTLLFRGAIQPTDEFKKSDEFDPAEPPMIYSYESQDSDVNGLPELFYLNATRFGPQPTSSKSETKVGQLSEFIFSTFDRIKNTPLPNELVKFPESKTINYQVSKWISEISGSILELKTEQISTDQIAVHYDSDGLENISPDNLGAGISYLAKVVILCLMAKKGDLVIIENPEIHLHPKSQAQLGVFFAFIASKGIQLIIETHCEHLINRVRMEVSNENLDSDDVLVHYKSSTKNPFQTLYIDIDGHYVDKDESRQSFPKGFFDASVDALLSLR
jgi:predicted ATPase